MPPPFGEPAQTTWDAELSAAGAKQDVDGIVTVQVTCFRTVSVQIEPS